VNNNYFSLFYLVSEKLLLVLLGLSILIVVAIALLIGACVLCGGLVILKRCVEYVSYGPAINVECRQLIRWATVVGN